jgi:hypothetical protein
VGENNELTIPMRYIFINFLRNEKNINTGKSNNPFCGRRQQTNNIEMACVCLYVFNENLENSAIIELQKRMMRLQLHTLAIKIQIENRGKSTSAINIQTFLSTVSRPIYDHTIWVPIARTHMYKECTMYTLLVLVLMGTN